jgi:ankyrin repeat protein
MPPTNLQQILEDSSLNTGTKRQRIQAFIDAGGDINALEENGYPSLYNEMNFQGDATVNILLDLGADVNIKVIYNKVNALIYAVKCIKNLSVDTYKRIIEKTEDLDYKDTSQHTALMEFSNTTYDSIEDQNKAKEVVEFLIQKGADPNVKSLNDMAALYMAIYNYNNAIAQAIANAPTLDLNSSQWHKASTYLIVAIQYNVIDVVRILLDRGADPSALTVNKRTTPLMEAVKDTNRMPDEDRRAIVRLLLDKGADKNVYNIERNFAHDYLEIEQIGEDLYSELKPTVTLPPQNLNRRNALFNNRNNNTASTASAHPPNNNRNNNNRNNRNRNNNTFNVGPEEEDEDYVHRINRTVANSIISTKATPRLNRVQVPLRSGGTDTLHVYDAIEVGDIDLTRSEIEEDEENIYFKVGSTYARLPIEMIQKSIRDLDAIQFECKREMDFSRDGTPKLDDLHMNRPYYLISTVGKYLVPLGEIIAALHSEHPHVYELVEEANALAFVSSFRAIQRPYQQGNRAIVNYTGRAYNIVGKDHCTAGTRRRVYSLRQVEFVDDAIGGAKKSRDRKSRDRKSRHRHSHRNNQKTRKLAKKPSKKPSRKPTKKNNRSKKY